MRHSTIAVSAFVGLLSLGACGQKNLGSTLAPPDQSASEALGQGAGQCTDVGTVAEPYVVDLRGTERSHLEAAMSEGLALVRYDCNGLEVLKGCSVEGITSNPYSFVAVSMKEDQVQIETLDQLKANLPASAATLEGELSSGAAIDIGLMMVGKRSTQKSTVIASELEGPGCEGATHFVREAIVGAFAVDKGTQGRARAAAEIFGASAAAGSEANKRVANRDGDPDACRSVRPGDRDLPESCRSAITILLYPVHEQAPPSEQLAAGDAEGSDEAALTALEAKCPDGFVRSQGKCARASEVRSFECKPGDREQCQQQCDAGNPGSCYHLALLERDRDAKRRLFERACDDPDGPADACTAAAHAIWFVDDRDDRDPKRYVELLTKGCDRGDSRGCQTLGTAQVGGLGIPKNVSEGLSKIERACGMGSRFACQSLATKLVETGVDPKRGLSMIDRLCSDGGRTECSAAANLYRSGRSIAKDHRKELGYRVKACELGLLHECRSVGDMHRTGTGTKKDRTRAMAFYDRACNPPEGAGLPRPPGAKPGTYGDSGACRELGRLQLAKSPPKAEATFVRGCDPSHGVLVQACADLGRLYAKGAKGVKKDRSKAQSILRQACDKRHRDSCLALGDLLESVDSGVAKAFYGEQCEQARGFGDMCKAFARLGGTPPRPAPPSGPPGPPRPPKS